MGVTWDDVGEALRTLPTYVRDVELWFSVADTMDIADDHVARVRPLVDEAFEAWDRRHRRPGASDETRSHTAPGL